MLCAATIASGMLTYKARMPNAVFIIVSPQPDAASRFHE
jgi:hypothetical protein